jgi:hypothetical protein
MLVCLCNVVDEPYPSKACALLDKYPNEFDPVEVLKLLPATIPLHILKNFLTYSLKHKTHKYVSLIFVAVTNVLIFVLFLICYCIFILLFMFILFVLFN